MKSGAIAIRFILALTLVVPGSFARATEGKAKQNPFRVVVVTGDQWEDPAGYIIGMPKATGEYSGYEAKPAVDGPGDFHDLVILLKSWCIPFDIIRLDQQYLDRYMFLDMHGKAKYGAIIWAVNNSDRILRQDYGVVTDIVKDNGIGLIAISDRITQPEIQELLGLKYHGSWESNTRMEITRKHFITESVRTSFPVDSLITGHIRRPQVELLEGTSALVTQGSWPQLTVKEIAGGGRAVWIGSDHNFMFSSQSIRTMFRKTITWVIGYSLFRTWENDVIMIMDDPGGAANNYLEHWHYPELSEELISKYLVDPLEKHQAILNVNFVPAFVNDSLGRLEPTWRYRSTDGFGTKQDYIASKRGWDEGVKKGVFTVMCHGLTHMQPDLHSDPGWYGSAGDREKSEVGWYREFGDTRRLGEIQAAEQLWRMKTASEWLREQFGVVPLEFCPGGLGSSTSYFNNTAALAGKAGYGWNGWESGYLGSDMVITGWKYFGTSESPLVIGAPPDSHDFGLSRSPGDFARIFDTYPGKKFISMDEFIGYLHSSNTGKFDPEKREIILSIAYDPHYCRWFETHPSAWRFELADWFKTKNPGSVSLDTGGSPSVFKEGIIKVPQGTGIHEIRIIFGK